MKRKLGINTATGIVNILSAVFIVVSFFVLVGEMGNIGYYSNSQELAEMMNPTVAIIYTLGWIVSIVPLVMSIISIVMSKKNGISMVGPIMGCVAAALNLITINILAVVIGILLIISGIFCLIQKNIDGFEGYNDEIIPSQSKNNNEDSYTNNTLGKEEEWKL